jgi:hypothetical protein
MTSSIYTDAAVISLIFFLVTFIEMRFLEKESKPLKYLIKDTLLVYFSVIIGFYILEQIKPVIDNAVNVEPAVFTDNPKF